MPPEAAVWLSVEAEGRIAMRGLWNELRDGVRVDVGDVPLLQALPVTVRVIDENSHPIAGLGLRVEF